MAIPKVKKTKRPEAERAAEWYAIEILNALVTRRAVKSRFQKMDFFGADVMGKRADGSMIFIQATAGQHAAVTKRRRKLEEIPWNKDDTVELVQLTNTPDPANARKKLWFFRVHVYFLAEMKGFRQWITLEKAVPVPKLWFKSYELYNKKDENGTSDNK